MELILVLLLFAGLLLGFWLFYSLLQLPSRLDGWREQFYLSVLRFIRFEVPVVTGLEKLSESSPWPFSSWLQEVTELLRQGMPLHLAVECEGPPLLPARDRALLRATDSLRSFQLTLEGLAALYRSRIDFRRRSRQQLVLPLYVLFTLLVAGPMVAAWAPGGQLIQAFRDIFADTGGSFDLPIMIRLAAFGMLGPIAAVVLMAVYICPRAAWFRDLAVRLPYLGRLVVHVEWLEIGRHLQAAAQAEQPLYRTLSVLPLACYTEPTRRALERLERGLSSGTPPEALMADLPLPEGWKTLVGLGLTTHCLALKLEEANAYLEESLICRLNRTESCGGVGLILLLGLCVGTIAWTVFSALNQLTVAL